MNCILTSALYLSTGLTILGLASSADSQTFAGQATAVRATVTVLGQPLVTTTVADTQPLNSAGGTITLSSVGVSLPGLLTVGSSTSSTSGAASSASSTSSVNSLNIGIPGNSITVSAITANSLTQCPGPSRSGDSAITNLQINGASISVSGDPNQTIPVLFGATQIGSLVINQQIPTLGGITVNALHLTVTNPLNSNLIDVVVASSRSGINCDDIPASNRFRGRGTGISLTQSSLIAGTVGTIISDTGPLPGPGGSLSASTAGAGLAPLLASGIVSVSSSGGPGGGNQNTTQSTAYVEDLSFSIGGPLGVSVSLQALTSTSQCTATAGVVNCTGTSSITNLAVTALGIPVGISIDGQPNQQIILPGGLGRLVINERSGVQSGSPAEITASALRVELTIPGIAATNLLLGTAHSGLYAGAVPTAANASISGKVTDPSGRSLPRTSVVLISGSGVSRIAITNAFGYFRFDDLAISELYVINVRSKRYRFEQRAITLNDSLADVDFTPVE